MPCRPVPTRTCTTARRPHCLPVRGGRCSLPVCRIGEMNVRLPVGSARVRVPTFGELGQSLLPFVEPDGVRGAPTGRGSLRSSPTSHPCPSARCASTTRRELAHRPTPDPAHRIPIRLNDNRIHSHSHRRPRHRTTRMASSVGGEERLYRHEDPRHHCRHQHERALPTAQRTTGRAATKPSPIRTPQPAPPVPPNSPNTRPAADPPRTT
jgi:hypothetical protein